MTTTQTERYTVHVYPRWMWPNMDRRISILFDDPCLSSETLAELELTADEARALAAELLRAAEIG